jgi:hypothetical protein
MILLLVVISDYHSDVEYSRRLLYDAMYADRQVPFISEEITACIRAEYLALWGQLNQIISLRFGS